MKANCYLFAWACLIFCSLNISCSKSLPEQAEIPKNLSLPQDGAAVISANDQFAFDFLHVTLQNDQTPTNKLISPLSVYLALSMVYNGAGNATRDSIQYALRAENISIDDINKTAQAMIQGIPLLDNQVTLSIANSIWYNQSIQPVQGFLSLIQQYYMAKIAPLNFEDPQSVNTINNWVADNTQQKITQVLDNINPSDLMFLINAIYFKGNWKYAFDPKATTDKSFNPAADNTVSTPFMALHDSLNYFQNDSVQMLQLPYGAGDFNMFLLLPSNNISIPAFTAALNPNSFNNWKSSLNLQDIQLGLPKFNYSYSINDMQPALTQMGMGIAFGDLADFSNMYNIPAKISKAIHKTFIEVNEEGTIAAAVTAIGVVELVSLSGPIILNFNRPFLYILQEKSSGAILFMGLLNDPSQQS
jgi:serine protease inhibitor